jgi:hypothetical protein
LKLHHGKNCAKRGGSVTSLNRSLHFGQRGGEFLFLESMPVSPFGIDSVPLHLEQHFCIGDDGKNDGD